MSKSYKLYLTNPPHPLPTGRQVTLRRGNFNDMSLTRYFIIMVVATALAWTSWGVVITQINPEVAGLDGFALFYTTLFLSLIGTFALIGLAIRMHTQPHHLPYYLVLLSFRQGIFFALLSIGALILQSKDILYWWNILILVVLLTTLEYFALTSFVRRPKRA